MTSAIDVERLYALGESESYTVKSAEGSIGWVEESGSANGARHTPSPCKRSTARLLSCSRSRSRPSTTKHGWVVVDEDLRLRELDSRRTQRRQAAETEWPLWKAVAVLYCTIALLLALMITVAFTIAWAVTGTAY